MAFCDASTDYQTVTIGYASECHSLNNYSYAFNIRGQQVPEYCSIMGYKSNDCSGETTLSIDGPTDPSICYTAINEEELVRSVNMICI